MLVFKLTHRIGERYVTRSLSFRDTGIPEWKTIATKIEELFFIPFRDVAIAHTDEFGSEIVLSSQVELEDYYASESFCFLCASNSDHGPLRTRCTMDLDVVDLGEQRQQVQARIRSPSSLLSAHTPVSATNSSPFEVFDFPSCIGLPYPSQVSPLPVPETAAGHLSPRGATGAAVSFEASKTHPCLPEDSEIPTVLAMSGPPSLIRSFSEEESYVYDEGESPDCSLHSSLPPSPPPPPSCVLRCRSPSPPLSPPPPPFFYVPTPRPSRRISCVSISRSIPSPLVKPTSEHSPARPLITVPYSPALDLRLASRLSCEPPPSHGRSLSRGRERNVSGFGHDESRVKGPVDPIPLCIAPTIQSFSQPRSCASHVSQSSIDTYSCARGRSRIVSPLNGATHIQAQAHNSSLPPRFPDGREWQGIAATLESVSPWIGREMSERPRTPQTIIIPPPPLEQPALLIALSLHLKSLAYDPRLGRRGGEELAALTNELLPELSTLTEAISSLARKVSLVDETKM